MSVRTRRADHPLELGANGQGESARVDDPTGTSQARDFGEGIGKRRDVRQNPNEQTTRLELRARNGQGESARVDHANGTREETGRPSEPQRADHPFGTSTKERAGRVCGGSMMRLELFRRGTAVKA